MRQVRFFCEYDRMVNSDGSDGEQQDERIPALDEGDPTVMPSR
jgi:hypothetical protein